jgi:hypothetical protein
VHSRRYGPDVLAAGKPRRRELRRVPAERGLVVEDATGQFGAWPAIPPGTPWKEGVLRVLGWPPDTGAAWQRILRSVPGFADLEPAFLGRVEELIDFVTAPGSQ